MAFVRLIRTDSCPAGRGRLVVVRGRGLAVFRLTQPERFAVIDDACPHAGGHLSAGQLEGTRVTCPVHHWEFDVTTGQGTMSEQAVVRCYPVETKDGYVYADLDAPQDARGLSTK